MTELPLEKGIRQLVDSFIEAGCPSVKNQTIAERRQGYLESVALAGKKEAVHQMVELNIEGISLRIYHPCENEKNLPVAVYFHGGCFISGDFETHDQQLRKLANLANSLVVAVKYRLAPEHTYPAAHDDAYRAAVIVHNHCEEWGGNPGNIVLMGDSAGGHLSLVTSLRLKAHSNWQPSKQILIYPMLDATASAKSYDENGKHYIVTKEMLVSGYDMYFDGISPEHPEATPLGRADLSDLPETHILTAEFDPLVDEGEQLYRNLLLAGVEAQCRRYLGVTHGFFQLSGISKSAREAIEHVASIIRTSE